MKALRLRFLSGWWIRRGARILQTFSASPCFVLLPLKLEKNNNLLDSHPPLAANVLAEGLGCSVEIYRQRAVLKIHIYFWERLFRG